MDIVKAIVEAILPIAATLAIAVLTPVAMWAGRKLQAKLNIDSEIALDQQLARIVEQGVYYAEEQGRQWAKDGETISPDGKLRSAIDYVSKRLEEMGIVAASAETITALIEAKLNQERPFMSETAGASLDQ